MIITIIGDIHRKIAPYQELLKTLPEDRRTIQIGDFGYNFVGVPDKFPDQHKFIRGNHDHPGLARAHHNYLGDFGYLPDEETFYIGGAFSIDKFMRIPGVSWWEEEELSYSELGRAIEMYKRVKPRIVLSHDCPTTASRILLKDMIGDYFDAKKDCQKSRTCNALQFMFEEHKPELWIFGHYHVNKQFDLDGTHFVCVAELSTVDLKYEI